MDPSSPTMEIKKKSTFRVGILLALVVFLKKNQFSVMDPSSPTMEIKKKIDIPGRNLACSGCFSQEKSIFRHGSVVTDHGNQKKNRHSGSESCLLWLFFSRKINFPSWIRRHRPWKSKKKSTFRVGIL